MRPALMATKHLTGEQWLTGARMVAGVLTLPDPSQVEVLPLEPGVSAQLPSGAAYTMAPDGSLRRLDKPRLTKKERVRGRRGGSPRTTKRERAAAQSERDHAEWAASMPPEEA